MNTMTKPLIPLGRIVITTNLDNTLAAIMKPSHLMSFITGMLARHQYGDWGCVCDEDKASNDEALKLGNRILSAYPIDPAKPCEGFGENTIWVITEADRSVTTLLLPEDY